MSTEKNNNHCEPPLNGRTASGVGNNSAETNSISIPGDDRVIWLGGKS